MNNRYVTNLQGMVKIPTISYTDDTKTDYQMNTLIKIAPDKLQVRYFVKVTSSTQLQDGTTYNSIYIIHQI
jgi:hypothetical protein